MNRVDHRPSHARMLLTCEPSQVIACRRRERTATSPTRRCRWRRRQRPPRGLKLSPRDDDQLVVSKQEFFTEEFHAQTNVASVLTLSGAAFGVWMLGAWMSNLHSSVHAIGAWMAIVGATVTVFCGWLVARAWSVRRRQGCASIHATRGRRCRHRPGDASTVLALLHGEAGCRPQRQDSSARPAPSPWSQ